MTKMFKKVIGPTLFVSMLLFTIPMASVGHTHPAMIKKMLAAHALWLDTHGLEGKRANFREMDLSSHNMTHVELSFAELSISNLSDIDLRWANLCNAILSGSNFSGADLSETDLSGATLTNAYLNGADLTGSNLRGASLAMTDLSGASLRFADLTNADLSGADLREVDLTGAILNGTKLQSARRLTIPMLANAKTLHGSNLSPQLKQTLQDLTPHLFEPFE